MFLFHHTTVTKIFPLLNKWLMKTCILYSSVKLYKKILHTVHNLCLSDKYMTSSNYYAFNKHTNTLMTQQSLFITETLEISSVRLVLPISIWWCTFYSHGKKNMHISKSSSYYAHISYNNCRNNTTVIVSHFLAMTVSCSSLIRKIDWSYIRETDSCCKINEHNCNF